MLKRNLENKMNLKSCKVTLVFNFRSVGQVELIVSKESCNLKKNIEIGMGT